MLDGEEPIDKYRYNSEDVENIIAFVFKSDFDSIRIVDGFNTNENALLSISVLTEFEIDRDTQNDTIVDGGFEGLKNEQEYNGHFRIKLTNAMNQDEVYADGVVKISGEYKNGKLILWFDDGFNISYPVQVMVNPEMIIALLRGYISKYWKLIKDKPFDKDIWQVINIGGGHIVNAIDKVNSK